MCGEVEFTARLRPRQSKIHAMCEGTPEQVKLIRNAIENGGLENIDQVMQAVTSTGAIKYTADAANKEAQLAIEALAVLPDSDYKEALQFLAEFSVNRSY